MQSSRIEVNPEIMRGKPVIKGTRITVEFVLQQLSKWLSVERFLENYPGLKREDITAALAFSSHFLKYDQMAYA